MAWRAVEQAQRLKLGTGQFHACTPYFLIPPGKNGLMRQTRTAPADPNSEPAWRRICPLEKAPLWIEITWNDCCAILVRET
eukprot:scaffold267073_cov15-Tisochrysis_lutea.AAC.1